MSSELHKPSGREGTGTFHSTKFVPKVARSLTGNHISVHTFKLEQYIKMLYPLQMFVNQLTSIPETSVQYIVLVSLVQKFLTWGSMDAQGVLG